jgi:hypothetical protein
MYALLGPPPALRKAARTIKSLSALSRAGSTIFLYSEFKYLQNSRRSLSTVQFTKDTQNSGNPGDILHAFHPLKKKIILGEDLGIPLGIKGEKMARLGRQTRPIWGAFCCSQWRSKLHIRHLDRLAVYPSYPPRRTLTSTQASGTSQLPPHFSSSLFHYRFFQSQRAIH